MFIRRLLFFLATILSITIYAQRNVEETSHRADAYPLEPAGYTGEKETADSIAIRRKVLFGINDATIDTAFCGNNASLSEFVVKIKNVFSDSTCQIRDIVITCGASPDGYYNRNLMLSRQRGNALAEYLSRQIGVESSYFRINSRGEDWEGLRTLVCKSDMDSREEVVDILDAHPDSISDEDELSAWRKQELHKIANGKAWMYLRDYIFPKLRAADNNIVCHFTRKQLQPSALQSDKAVPYMFVVHDTVVVRDTVFMYSQHTDTARPAPVVKTDKQRSLFIKTNAVGLAMLVANGAIEYQFHRNWSVCLPVYWSGWDYFSRDMKFRCLLFQPEIRYWGLPIKGLFVGAHVGTGWYNYTMPGLDYRYQDKDGTTPLLNAGVSLGYRHSLGRSQRWMMEYSVGGGYVSTSYDRFFNVRNGQLFDTHSNSIFLVDQVNLSLVYRIPLNKRGGER